MFITSLPQHFETRNQWRNWLSDNFEIASEVWFVHPNKSSGKKAISYNDAVEEALCFGWIDSTVKRLDNDHRVQRFTPRKPKSPYSQPNKERLRWLLANDMIHPKLIDEIGRLLSEPFVFPIDIMSRLKADKSVWKNFESFSASYQRIRIAYIDSARNRPEEFEKRLNHFIGKTKQNKKIVGFGGIDKYY